MYDVISTSDTKWLSQRFVTVWNGQNYEVQMITGQALTSESPLTSYEQIEDIQITLLGTTPWVEVPWEFAYIE